MTVLHLISSEGYYGAESMLVLLAHNLQRHGCRVLIGVFRDSRGPHLEVAERARVQGLETEIIPCSGRLGRHAVRHIRDILDAKAIDVLHAHGYKTNLYGWAAAWPDRVALVSTCHSWQRQRLLRMRIYSALDRLVLKRFHSVAAVSDAVAQALESSGLDPARVATIPNGMATERVDEVKPALREEWHCATDPIVGMVARLVPGKGGDVLLRAAPTVLAEFPNARFTLVGGGPCRASWEALAAELGVARNVVFTGVRSDMAEVYASLNTVVLPSFSEGMPMCLLEAMAAGRPVIATAVGSVGRLVIPNRTGMLVERGDVNGLAQAILSLLRDPARARELGENGRAHIATNFSVEAMTRRYLQLYQDASEMRARRMRSIVAWKASRT